MLTYFYPPMGGAGVQRSLKFSRYLPGFGILPSVVCADSAEYPHDDELLREVPSDVDVTRIPHTTLLARIMSLRRRWPSPSASRESANRGPAEAAPPPRASPWRDRLISATAAIQFPDDKTAWSSQAQRASMRALPNSPVDIVYSSSPPVSVHRAAMRIARHAGVPWVADYRDLWTGNPAYAAPSWRRPIDHRWERRLLASADGIVTVTEAFASELSALAGSRVPTIVIPNGYDEADFAGLVPVTLDPGVFRIVHTGTFYGQRSPEPLLLGVQRVLQRDAELRARLRVRLVGSIGSRFDPLLDWFSRQFPGVLERTGYVNHSRALAEMLGASALLLVVDYQDEVSLPGKVFEYLRAGRPILLIGPPKGESAKLIRECKAGEVVDAGDHHQIAATIGHWIARGTGPTPDPARVGQFERRVLSRELAHFLVDVHKGFPGRYRRHSPWA
jgi:glycosyltransferase involved in cell wall biosynthesis